MTDKVSAERMERARAWHKANSICDEPDCGICKKEFEMCATFAAEEVRLRDEWKLLPELPDEDTPVLIAVMTEVDDHGTGEWINVPEVYRGTIYTGAPGMVIADCEVNGEYETEEILGWKPLPIWELSRDGRE